MEKEVPPKTQKVDWRNFSTADELKKFLNSDQAARKMKFAVRVFYVLQWTKEHPQEMAKTGAMWCRDGFHFICNSQALGEFLLIKPNTINTNFRSHSFVIELNNSPSTISEFPNMRDIKNWRKRSNPYYSFTINSKESDIVMIPCKPNMDYPKQFNFISSHANMQQISDYHSYSQDYSSLSQRAYPQPNLNSDLITINQKSSPSEIGKEISLSQDPQDLDLNSYQNPNGTTIHKNSIIQQIDGPLSVPSKSQNPLFSNYIIQPNSYQKPQSSIPIILPDSNNNANNINSNTTNVNAINISNDKKKAKPQSFPPRLQHKYVLHSSLPEAVYNFIKEETEAIFETELLFSKLKKSTAYKNLIILEALKEWLQISETPTAPFDSVCEYIIKDCDAQNKQKLYSNVSYLLRSPGSNITDTVPFASFVKFIAQYGYVPNCQKNIIDLSSTNNDENFEKWFQPFISDAGITQLLSKQPLEITWILRPSVVVGMFSLHQLFNGKIISTSIDFNPTAPIEDNRSFSIVGEKEGLIQAGSIRHLLLDLLDLSGN